MAIWMALSPLQPRVISPSVILNLAVRLSTIFTTWRIPEISLLYASLSLGKPGVVHEASILCFPWVYPSIIRDAVTHWYFKEPLLNATSPPFLMESAICLSVSIIDLYPGFQVLALEVYVFPTVRPILVHLMFPSFGMSNFVTMPCEGGYLVISSLILTKSLWISLPCRLRTGL